MSTPEWIAALGLFLAHPELLIATVIFAILTSSIAWRLRGHIVRAHIDELESRIDGVAFEEKKCEDALQEVEQVKQKVEALERENAELRAQIPQAKEVVLSDDTKRVLMHMFKAAQGQEVGAMVTALSMEKSSLQYHLELLLQSGLADMVSLNYREGKIYWVLTQKGRQHVVESKLI